MDSGPTKTCAKYSGVATPFHDQGAYPFSWLPKNSNINLRLFLNTYAFSSFYMLRSLSIYVHAFHTIILSQTTCTTSLKLLGFGTVRTKFYICSSPWASMNRGQAAVQIQCAGTLLWLAQMFYLRKTSECISQSFLLSRINMYFIVQEYTKEHLIPPFLLYNVISCCST